MAKNKLSAEMKAYIITQLATYERPSVIRDAVKKEWNIQLSLSSIVYYDPSTAGTDLAKKWTTLFETTRARFIAAVSRQPIVEKAYRTKVLQDALDKEIERENTVGIRQTLEHFEKVEGGAFTNKRELSGTVGVRIEDIIRAAEGITETGPNADRRDTDG